MTFNSNATVHDTAEIVDPVDLASGVVVGPDAIVGAQGGLGKQKTRRRTTIHEGASIGARAIVMEGLSVGAGCVLLPGTVLTADAPPMTVVGGNPGSVLGYVESKMGKRHDGDFIDLQIDEMTRELPGGSQLIALSRVVDLRGSLIICEHGEMPFSPARTFIVTDVAPGLFRGAHAHRECSQALFCVQGSVSCLLDDGERRAKVVLSRPDVGVHIPPYVWGMQYEFSPSSVLVVFASHPYNSADYIDSYDAFLAGLN